MVDAKERLVEESSIISLALARPGTMVRDVVDTEDIFVSADTNQEECARVTK